MRLIKGKAFFILNIVLIFFLSISFKIGYSSQSDTLVLKDVNKLLKNGQFEKAERILDSIERIYRNDNNTVLNIYSQIRKAQLAYMKRDIKVGFRIIQRAQDLCQNIQNIDSTEYADVNHVLGMHYYLSGDFNRALVHCKKALHIKKNGVSQLSIPNSYTYNLIATISLAKRDFLYAHSNYELAKYNAIQYEGVEEDDVDIAAYFINIGIVHGQLGNYELSESNFRKGLEIYNNKGAKKSKYASALMNIGRLFEFKELNDSALFYYSKAEEAYIQSYGKEYRRLSGVYLNMGNVFVKLSDNESALLYYEKALSIYSQFLHSDHYQIQKVIMNIGYVFEVKDEFERAIDYYKIAIKDNGQVGIRTSRNMANCYSNLDEYEKAEEFYNQSIERCLNLDDSQVEELSLSYMYYGDFLVKKDVNPKKGIQILLRADSLLKNELKPNKRNYSKLCYYIGDYYNSRGELGRALEAYHKSLLMIGDGFVSSDILAVPADTMLYLDNIQLNVLKRKANCLYKYYLETGSLEYLRASYKTYKTTIDFIGALQLSMHHEESKLYFTDRLNSVFDQGILALNDWYASTRDDRILSQAFEFGEKGKSSVLLAAIKEVEAMQVSKIPPDLQKVEQHQRNDISFYTKMIYSESQLSNPDTTKIALWKNVLFDKKRSHDSLITRIESEYPDYYNLKIDQKVMDIRSIQKRMNEDEALLEYILTDSIIFTFVITSNDAHLETILYTDTIFTQNVDRMRDCLTANEFTNYSQKDYKNFISSSYYLFQNLIEPVEAYLDGKKLIIVPDGMLGYIPFEILLTSFPDPKLFSYKDLEFLIKKNPISYTYSATLLYKASQKKERARKNLLAFAPSYSKIEKEDSLKNRRGTTPEHLFPIPGVKDEVSYINEVYHGDVFFDDLASEQLFKDMAKDYNVLHLAMHTLIDDENPLYSNLVFSQNKEGGQDGLLNAYELFNMEMNADMAVLSACNTGYGRLHGGEGIMSLARGFLYAGVNSIIMTLWAVEDHSSAGLMQIFYRNLSEGMDKDIALQKAKIEYIEESHQLGAHPHYWAGYVNIGETHPLYQIGVSKDSMLLMSSGGVLILLLAGVFGIRFIRRRK